MRSGSRVVSARGLLKIAGLAGAVGVAATGVLVARNERQRRGYEPDEIRERLHQRLAMATSATEPDEPSEPREQVGFLRRAGAAVRRVGRR